MLTAYHYCTTAYHSCDANDNAPKPGDIHVWLWLAWATGRGHAWAQPVFAAFFGLVTAGWLIVLAAGGGSDATSYTWAGLLATTVLWLAGLVAMTLIFSQTASTHYQRRAAMIGVRSRKEN